jgi:hypothetical protein
MENFASLPFYEGAAPKKIKDHRGCVPTHLWTAGTPDQ